MMFLLSFFLLKCNGLSFQTWSDRNLLIWKEKWYCLTSFLKPTPVFVNLKIFRKMVILHITWSINIKFLLWNVNDDKFFCVPNFDSGSLICSEVVANKSFSIGKPIRPRFIVFKAGNHFHLETLFKKIVELLTASITFPLFYNKEGKDSLKSFAPSFIRSVIPCPAYSEHLLLEVVWLRKAT